MMSDHFPPHLWTVHWLVERAVNGVQVTKCGLYGQTLVGAHEVSTRVTCRDCQGLATADRARALGLADSDA